MNNTNPTAKVIQFVAVLVLLLSVILGVVYGKISNPLSGESEFFWSISFLWWVPGIVVTTLLFGVAAGIDILDDIRSKVEQQRVALLYKKDASSS